jgi:hypothetical protein
MNRSQTGVRLKNLIEKIKYQNNISYPQMAEILTQAGYEVQPINLRRIGHGIAQSLSVHLANGLIDCFGHTITATEVFYAMGFEFVLNDELTDKERELISGVRSYPANAQIPLLDSLLNAIKTFISVLK